MTPGEPAQAGYRVGAARPPLGRAQRFDAGDDREIFRVTEADAGTAGRLLALGSDDVGGFIDGGRDAAGIWLVRRIARTSLASFLRTQRQPMPWRQAVQLTQAFAQAAAATESAELFPGPLAPETMFVDSEPDATAPRVQVPADEMVAALFGAVSAPSERGADEAVARRWIAPAQAEGAPWDHAANRYVLGCLLYRLLSGENPFGGRGLRLGLEQARRGAPPLADAIAAELPPGLQALCLRMLSPEPSERPSSARELATKLARFAQDDLEDPRVHRASLPRASATRLSLPRVSAVPAQAPRPRARGLAWPIAGALALSALAFWLFPEAAPRASTAPAASAAAATARAAPVVAPQVKALDLDSASARDCARCHARQAAEWQGSVMGHAARSPLFQALEIAIQEQVGRSDDCPGGAGILRKADPRTACMSEAGLPITGSGGAHWCVNCHTPLENLAAVMPAWDGRAQTSATRRPLRDLMPESTLEGIGCLFCHSVHGPVVPGAEARGGYEGNPSWRSFQRDVSFAMRPEDQQARPGIANSGYLLDPQALLVGQEPVSALGRTHAVLDSGVHRRPSAETRGYLRSSEFCGACHDVRLFGTDTLGARQGEHFKRLRNAYSEWAAWSAQLAQAGTRTPSCQDCHMSLFPGVCVKGPAPAALQGRTALLRGCPDGTHFEARAPGSYAEAHRAGNAQLSEGLTTHYFSGVDVPLSDEFPAHLVDQPRLDSLGVPIGARQRRDLLLGSTFRFALQDPRRAGAALRLPLVIENVGAGHRVPAGFSQEREFWVHLTVTDAEDQVVYEVGRVERGDEDLRDKIFVRINGDDPTGDGRGVFGADVIDGPDVPHWSPQPHTAATEFVGRGLVNLQNGFLRCVACATEIDGDGRCQPRQLGEPRAARYRDGDYDLDTGRCRSNLPGHAALFEVYFPIGALDASRGEVRGPDAIIDTRSAPPNVPLRYTYELDTQGHEPPFRVVARLMFRAFPPFLLRGFAAYEAAKHARGMRPSGPLVTERMLGRLEAIELERVEAVLR